MTGQIWSISVDVVMKPTFAATEVAQVEMAKATHVVWSDDVLCEDLRLSRPDWEKLRKGRDAGKRVLLPHEEWPDGQRFVSLQEVRDGVAPPEDRCELCWANANSRIAEILKMMKDGAKR